jgi:hypothetical protein
MARPFTTVHNSVETIVSGARLLAVAQDLDPAKMESIVRKAVRIAQEAMIQDASATMANDNRRAK